LRVLKSDIFFQISHRNRKDAVKFEALRQEFGTDEIEAWAKYTNWKMEIGERREVIACHKYDTAPGGVSTGRWSKDEHKQFLQALVKVGKSYRKIANLIGSRKYSQVKSYGKKYFYEGG
jgi:SHAQKYF class myb-like DNA-binding protein